MSAFRDLMHEAYVAGADRIAFDVDADLFFHRPDAEAWKALTTRPGMQTIMGRGRTGEEALRKLVVAMTGAPPRTP